MTVINVVNTDAFLKESLLTTQGDIVVRGASAGERLGVGGDNTLLASNGTTPSWTQLLYAMIASGALATAGEFQDAAASKLLSAAEVWDAAALTVLTDGATIDVDMSAGINFGGGDGIALSLGGNRTLVNPTLPKTGQSGMFLFTATGSTRTLTLGSYYIPAVGVESFPISITTSETVGLPYWVMAPNKVIITAVLRFTTGGGGPA